MTAIRDFAELQSSGLLWLINRVVFHPRGYALGIDFNEKGEATGWCLIGDGSEVFSFVHAEADLEDTLFRTANQTLSGSYE